MDERIKPVLVGLGAGAVSFVLPEGLGPVTVIVAALAAGWVLPGAPMTGAILFLVPALLVGAMRLLLSDVDVNVPALALGILGALVFTAIFTHIGAGLALRRRAAT